MGPNFPTLLNEAQSRMEISGSTTSKFFIGSSLGRMAIPWLMGQVITPYRATAVMVTPLASVLLATGTFYVLNLMQRKMHRSPPRQSLDGINAG